MDVIVFVHDVSYTKEIEALHNVCFAMTTFIKQLEQAINNLVPIMESLAMEMDKLKIEGE